MRDKIYKVYDAIRYIKLYICVELEYYSIPLSLVGDSVWDDRQWGQPDPGNKESLPLIWFDDG